MFLARYDLTYYEDVYHLPKQKILEIFGFDLRWMKAELGY